MRYYFYYFNDGFYQEKIASRNEPLNDLFQFLTDKQSYWIKATDDDHDPRKVIIWSEWIIKQAVDYKKFPSEDVYLKYVDQYHTYGRKRFKEMPCIRIFKNNLEFLEQQWQEIRIRKPKYLILREHDNGFVDIVEKNELSEQDLALIEREGKIFSNHLKRWNEYVKAHPEKRNPLWRSPADDEYESDFALYDPVDEQGVD